MAMEQVSEVGRGLVMEGFVREEEDFELNTLLHYFQAAIISLMCI